MTRSPRDAGPTAPARRPTPSASAPALSSAGVWRAGRAGLLSALALVVLLVLPTGAFALPPTVSIDPPSATVVAGGSVSFTATATVNLDLGELPGRTIASYDWDLDGNGSFGDASGPNASHTYLTPGTFTVKVQATDTVGEFTFSEATVTVEAPPNQAPTVSIAALPGMVYAGQPPIGFAATANDPGGAITSMQWDLDDNGTFGDATGTTANASFSVGPHTVRVRVFDNGTPQLSATAQVAFTARQRLIVGFDAAPPTVALGAPVTLHSTSVGDGGLAHSWDLAGGTSPSATAPDTTVTFSTPGPKLISLSVSDTSGTQTAEHTVTVLPNKPPVAAFNYSPRSPGGGQTVSFTSTSSDPDDAIASQVWDLDNDGQFDDATGATAQRAFPSFSSNTVSLLVTDSRGVSSIAFQTIETSGPSRSATDVPSGSAPDGSASAPRPPQASASTSGTLLLLRPFPLVRIRGRIMASGVRIDLFTVRAQLGAAITARCKGRSCPWKSARKIARSSRRSIHLRGLERSMRAGTVIEILVTKKGRIGKYTRFVIRKGAAPARRDLCVRAGGATPSQCPSR